MLKIYHNTRCKKSRAGLQYIQDRKIPVQVIQYLKSPMTATELEAILMKLDKTPIEIIRTQEADYKSKFKDKELTEKEWIKVLVKYPHLLQRPIVVSKYKAVIGDPPENIKELL